MTREVPDFDVCQADLEALARKRAALRLGGLKAGTINVSQERQEAVRAALVAGQTQAHIAATQKISTKTIQKIKNSSRICQ